MKDKIVDALEYIKAPTKGEPIGIPRSNPEKNPFKPGHVLSKAENLTPDQNHRRMMGLVKTWKSRAAGLHKKPKRYRYFNMSKEQKAFKNKKKRLEVAVAREAREVQEFCRKLAPAAMDRLSEIAADPGPLDNVALQSINMILDRAYGKPNQTNTNLNVDANGKAQDVSNAELDTRIGDALKRVEELTRGAPKAAKGKEQPVDIRKRDRDPDGSNERLH